MGKHFKYVAGMYDYAVFDTGIPSRQKLKLLVKELRKAGVNLSNVMVLTGYPDEDGVEQYEPRAVYSPRRDTNMVYHVGDKKAEPTKPPFTGPFMRLEAGGLLWFDPKNGMWRTVPSNHAWYIVTMLRGPDNNDVELKKMTTGRIRGLFRNWAENKDISDMMTFGNQGCVARPMTLTRDDISALVELLKSAPEHFRDHFKHAEEAVKALWGDWPYQQ